ncbi:UNVERIFIED_CONTAM: hypothetical protein Scaly_0722500 [Sesamum calycinum]|uniref:Uncharacterized protein n=1 Tax=Sesamum calycinum TaxID=2727403 RepID=A0AAW2R801_9LAMI
MWPFSDMASKKRQRFRISSSFEAERSNYADWFGEELVREPSSSIAWNRVPKSSPCVCLRTTDSGLCYWRRRIQWWNFPFGKDAASTARPVDLGIVEIDEPSSATSSLPNHDSNFMKSASPAGGPGATTRKSAVQVERQNSEASYYADDEDGNRKKYSRRGTFRHKFLRSLLPFWSSALPTLPVTAPPQKDVSHADDAPEGRVWQQWVFCITELRNPVWEMIWLVKGYSDQWYYDMYGAAG